jgi:hypothetical protein
LATDQQKRSGKHRLALLFLLHKKTILSIVAGLAVWIMLGVVLHCLACDYSGVQSWIELFNGATWPEDWSKSCMSQGWLFAMALSARTALNVAGPLAVIGGAVWVFTGGLERVMQMKRVELMRLLSAEIVSAVSVVARKHHPDFSVNELEEMQKAAAQAVDEFSRDVERLEAKEKGRQVGSR